MYICVRLKFKRNILSVIQNTELTKNLSIHTFLNSCKLYSTNFTGPPLRNFTTLSNVTQYIKQNPAHTYLIQRDNPNELESHEEINKSIISKLEELSKHLEIRFDSIPYDLNYNDQSHNFIHPSHRYPKDSFSSDGFINLSLTNSELYMKFVCENKLRQNHELILNRKLVPSTSLLNNANHLTLSEKDLQNAQNLVDTNLSNMLKVITYDQAFVLIKKMYLLNLSVSYKNLCELLNLCHKYLNKLSMKEQIELAICVRSYIDNDHSYLRYYMAAIGSAIQDKLSLDDISQKALIDYLLPISLMQFNKHPFNWLIVSNSDVLNKITQESSTLPDEYKAKVVTILSSLEPFPDTSAKYYKVYDSLINSLQDSLHLLPSNELLNMMNMNILFPNLQIFREHLFKEALNRWNDLPLNTLAMLYLKYKYDIPKEVSDLFLKNIALRLRLVSEKYLPELYCSYLKNGVLTSKQSRTYEYYLGLRYTSLSIKNISNLLMYLSINGKSTCRIYGVIIRRFQQLKDANKINNQELLDVVLSMSLVGLHTRNVWTNVNLPNLVFQTPKNVLVYLGYAFLITDQKDEKLWNVLVERILGECKHYNSETYEVLKAAQILNYIPQNSNLNRLLSQCKHLYLSKLSRQRYRSKVPYEEVFEKLGIRYKKEITINELYEAPYVLNEFGVIIEPTRDHIYHPTSGLLIGEAMLRHRVWAKLNYKIFSFHDSQWNKFYNENSEQNSWDIDKISTHFCKTTKLNHLISNTGKMRSTLLKIKSPETKRHSVLKTSRSSSVHSTKIKRLQSIITQQSQQS